MNHTCLCLPSRSWYSTTHLPTPEGWKAELDLADKFMNVAICPEQLMRVLSSLWCNESNVFLVSDVFSSRPYDFEGLLYPGCRPFITNTLRDRDQTIVTSFLYAGQKMCGCIIVSAVGYTWWDWSLILRTHLPSVLWHCWLGHLTRKNRSPIWPLMCLVGR